jgi:hypothetical protein
VVDKLLPWKGKPMHKSDRLMLIKSTLAAVPIHLALILELMAWVRKALVKIMRVFLWTGTEAMQSGKCAVAWDLDHRPLALGGLGIPDLRLMGMSLRLCWLWLWRDRSRPWAGLPVVVGRVTKSFFRASTTCVIGDGEETLFWKDPWLDGRCLEESALDLWVEVDARRQKCRIVAQALANRAWVRDITGALSIPAIIQYLHLRAHVDSVQL